MEVYLGCSCNDHITIYIDIGRNYYRKHTIKENNGKICKGGFAAFMYRLNDAFDFSVCFKAIK